MKRRKLPGKWVRKDNENVRSFWTCPECGKTYDTTFGDIAEVGTPVCPNDECDCDCEFSHVLVKKSKSEVHAPVKLRVKMGSASLAKEDRPVCDYKFSTVKDREAALRLLDDFNGFLDYDVLLPR